MKKFPTYQLLTRRNIDIRGLSLICGIPASTLYGYFAGRQRISESDGEIIDHCLLYEHGTFCDAQESLRRMLKRKAELSLSSTASSG